jgi:hypothetical protein
MKTKAEWAAAKAASLLRQADQWPTVRSADWQSVRRRMRALQTLREEARRFERLAERFKAQGV